MTWPLPLLIGLIALGGLVSGGLGMAQAPRTDPLAAAIFDPGRKPERPEPSVLRPIRFLTDDDYPPFHFLGPDGQLTGFNIDLARAICEELKVACTIQPRRWDTLLASLEEGRGDAVIASLMRTEALSQKAEMSVPYLRTPARFVTLANGPSDPSQAALKGKRIAVVRDSAHAAYLSSHYPGISAVLMPDHRESLRLLTNREVDAVFGDAIQLAVFLNGSSGRGCCRFLGDPFFDSRYFGEGATIAIRKDQVALRRAIDWALYRVVESGVYQQIMLRYFPVALY